MYKETRIARHIHSKGNERGKGLVSQFHRNLNRMALFTALIGIGGVLVRHDFMNFAVTNIYMNGAIIGVTLFGVLLSFIHIFALLPEHAWMTRYFRNRLKSGSDYPPLVLRPIAIMLNQTKALGQTSLSPTTLNNFLEIILSRFEDQRESVRYVTGILISLGLLGTFWGLLHITGGFADLLTNIRFEDETSIEVLRDGLAGPLSGIGTAFSTSFFGLGGSLIVGFLGLQAQLAQNALFRELEEGLAARVRIEPDSTKLTNVLERIEDALSRRGM